KQNRVYPANALHDEFTALATIPPPGRRMEEIVRGCTDLTFLLVHVDANMVHGWPLLSAPVSAVFLWGSLCHHVEWGVSRFIPSMLRGRLVWVQGEAVQKLDGQRS